MLWSQYKLVTIRRTEILRKEITGILNIANRNSNFWTLQTSEFQKKIHRNLWNQKRNQNSVYDGGPRNQNRKLEFPTKPSGVYWQSSNLSRSFGTSLILLTLSLYMECNAHSVVIYEGIGSKQHTPLL